MRALADYDRLLDTLDIEATVLAETVDGARADLRVPHAPGLTVGETARHVGSVYRMALEWTRIGDSPESWQREPGPFQSLRDYVISGSTDTAFLRYTWSAVKQAMEHLRQYDTDGDGMIKNGGFPDQTYDSWIARGESAYSGSLYLAALRATTEMAPGKPEAVRLVPSIGSTATSTSGSRPFPICSPK